MIWPWVRDTVFISEKMREGKSPVLQALTAPRLRAPPTDFMPIGGSRSLIAPPPPKNPIWQGAVQALYIYRPRWLPGRHIGVLMSFSISHLLAIHMSNPFFLVKDKKLSWSVWQLSFEECRLWRMQCCWISQNSQHISLGELPGPLSWMAPLPSWASGLGHHLGKI